MIPIVLLAILIAGWNNALHLAPAKQRDFVVAGGVTTAGVVGGAWLSSSFDLTVGLAAAIPWAIAAAAAAAVLALVAWLAPRVGKSLADQRIVAMSWMRFVAYAVLRIPVVSGLAEEILFRGVMWALLTPVVGAGWTLAITSFGFGLWHVVVSAQQARRMGVQAPRWVTVNVIATLVAGVLLGVLRLETGGVWAPAVVHALVNVGFAVAARIGATRHLPAGQIAALEA